MIASSAGLTAIVISSLLPKSKKTADFCLASLHRWSNYAQKVAIEMKGIYGELKLTSLVN
jgi:hypothetical protein